MDEILVTLLNLYVICIFGRIVLSWFPVTPGGPVAQISSFLYTITEPVLGPIRRILPNLGGIDVSPIILLLIIFFIQRVIVLYIYPAVP